MVHFDPDVILLPLAIFLEQPVQQSAWTAPSCRLFDNHTFILSFGFRQCIIEKLTTLQRGCHVLFELLEQLHTPPTDELTDHWQRIAAEVAQLNQGMREQKRLREELAAIEAQLLGLRSTILNDLHAVQRIADHQLVQARLRSEVSTLAQNRLATRLQHPPE